MKISDRDLLDINIRSEDIGHRDAVRDVLGFPELPENELKEKALTRYVREPAGHFHPYLLERSWILAYGDILKIDLTFPIDQYVLTNPKG